MTERCQTKFIEKFDNQNYIFYVGVLCTSVAVLYFYRFHFATIAFSYVLGCVACYYAINSSILHNYVDKLKCHFVPERPDEELHEAPVIGCVTCGSTDCSRHDDSGDMEPWTGLQIHKQLDQAIEDFYNTILEQFVSSWYSKVTLQPFFVDELRHQLRYASSCLLKRAVKINYSRFITERLVPCALHHYSLCSEYGAGAGAPVPHNKMDVHPAAANRNAELKYLRCITNAIMPYLLRSHELQNNVFRVLIREIFAGWVLLSLTDVLADPYILNTLIILATGDETMAQLPTTPNYKVEFLETFVRQTESVYIQRCSVHKVDLDLVINDQEYFYAFMQYMKTTTHLHLLQFYKDIKSFQIKILNPELSSSEQASLHRQACDIYSLYLSPNSVARLPLHPAIAQELYTILNTDDSVKRLQTSRALYQAARQSHAVLEKIMLPKFLHSEEFYKLIIGSRIPSGYQKQMTKKPQDRLLNTALKLGNRLKGALKPQTLDGQILDSYNDESEGDGVDNMDILKYLDSIAADKTTGEQDMSTYKVVLTNVETKLQAPPRRGTIRVFTLAVHRVGPSRTGTSAGPGPGPGPGPVPGPGPGPGPVPGPGPGPAAAMWTVQRSENDFHLLRAKLHEFHGDTLLIHLALPSRRDNSPLETLRYKYEDFLQRLLQKSLLQTSELLHIFLTVDSDFSTMVQASTLNANSTDLVNIYQSVTHRLKKEKGQHLESFLRNLLVSSDMERYQALKQGSHVEEAQEMSEDIQVEQLQVKRLKRARNILYSVFENNFNVDAQVLERDGDTRLQTTVVGFTHCFMYLLTKVIRARGLITGVIGSVLGYIRHVIDDVFNRFLNHTLCSVLSERRLAHLIRLGHGVLFGKRASMPRLDATVQRELARAQLLASIPSSATLLVGTGLTTAVHRAFDIIQRPQLNKQLVYNLLDLCIVELFPELQNSPSSEPKS